MDKFLPQKNADSHAKAQSGKSHAKRQRRKDLGSTRGLQSPLDFIGDGPLNAFETVNRDQP